MGETASPLPTADRSREPWGSWSTLFQHSADPVFLLSRRRQIRYVNRAWETLTGKFAEAVRGAFCLPRKKKGTAPLRALLQMLAPPPEAMAGRTITVRRPVPPARLGPPWWDLTFIPLRDDAGLTGILGFIHVGDAPAELESHTGFSESIVALRQQTAVRFTFDLLASETSAMQRIESQSRLAASNRTPVWIVGEAGTGKETLARVIHFQGCTAERTFVAVDCRGLQPFLIRNMLFGYAGQAGTRLGTIFLKEPARLPREMQTELLDWFEEQDAPPRIVVGSRDQSGDDLRAGRLVDEFHTSFNVLEIRLPPLRERLPDLARLIGRLSAKEVAPEALDLLRRHYWPGNLRELGDVLRAAASTRIEPAHLPLHMRTGFAPPKRPAPKLDEVLEQVEVRMIRLALKKAKGNKSEAADALGVPRARLLRRIEMLKIGSESRTEPEAQAREA